MPAFTLRTVVSLAIFSLVNAIPASLDARAGPIRPSQDSFYAVPEGIDRVSPGTILKHRTPPSAIAAFGLAPLNLQASHQILYRTTDNFGNATATVTTVLIPHNANTNKVLSYQTAEDAASIDCAPSYALQLESATGPLLGTIITQAQILFIEAALEQGWVVILPDFQGPKAAFLANKLAGHATLDGIRAALNSRPFTGIEESARIAIWGYSGGGIATNWAAELQPTYAPELKIVGAAVGGTVPNIATVVKGANRTPNAGLIPTGILGLSAQYLELATLVDQHLKPEYFEKFHKAQSQCFLANVAEYLLNDVVGMFDDRQLLYTDPLAVKIIKENGLGQATPRIPFFWYKSVFDETSPIDETDALVKKYCSQGVSINYVRDLASDHTTMSIIGAPKALSWLKYVLDGHAPNPGCSTKTVLSSLLDPASIEILPKFILDALLELLGKPVGSGIL